MNLSIKQVAATVFLTLLALSSVWLVYKNIFKTVSFTPLSDKSPTAILQGVSTINYDPNGEIKSRMTATELTYYAGSHKSEFTQPKLIFYQQDKTPWDITANEGTAINNNEMVKLINNVKIWQNLGKNNPENVISTSELTIYPNKNYAETDRPVSFTQLNQDKTKTTMQSVGATVDQKTGEVRLLSKIRGTYALH